MLMVVTTGKPLGDCSGDSSVPPIGTDALLPPDVARRAEAVGVTKVAMPLGTVAVLSVLAGAFIALGAVFSTVVTAGGEMAPGLARLLGGLVFSLGLVLVVVAGAELFTGNALVMIATASRRVRVLALMRNWLIVYVGNFVGAVATTLGVVWSGIYERGDGAVGVRALDIAATKTSLGAVEALWLGVFANALVCLAVWMSLSARSVTDKVVAVVFPITAFVAAGFEHSIANMYFIPAGLFIRSWAPDSFWAATGTSSADFASITWRDFVVGNLVPVTIGNIVGGALLVGLVYWFVYLRARSGDTAAPAAIVHDDEQDVEHERSVVAR
jgi:formate/nitrite transporter